MSLGRKIFKLFSCIFACAFFTCAGMSVANAANYVFYVKTTDDIQVGDVFWFNISAAGTFDVDCGSGGTLGVAPGGAGSVSGTIINRTSITSNDTYTCTYDSAGAKIISFGREDDVVYDDTDPYIDPPAAAISFSEDTVVNGQPITIGNGYVKEVSGSLAKLFPYYGPDLGQYPIFKQTFSGCDKLDSVSADLFYDDDADAYKVGRPYMFTRTFDGCTSLQSIPAGLFSRIESGAYHMFEATFIGCTGLTEIPGDLFKGLRVESEDNAEGMFAEIFLGCTGLTALPPGLFAGVLYPFDGMFAGAFSGCSGLSGYVPSTFFAGLVDEENPENSPTASNLFNRIFVGCPNLDTDCPENTIQYITGYESYWYGVVSCIPLYKMSYDCGAGSGSAPSDTEGPYESGEEVTVLESTCTPQSGYEFNYWSCNNGVGIKHAGDTFHIGENDVDCTAQYRVMSHTVTYDCGTGAGNGATVLASGSYTVSGSVGGVDNCSPLSNNYEFVEWVCGNTNGNFVNASFENSTVYVPETDTRVINAGGSFTYGSLANDLTCVALWRQINPCTPGTTINYILGVPENQSSVILGNHGGAAVSPIPFYQSPDDASTPMVYSIKFTYMTSVTPGVESAVGNPSNTSGNYCWCRVTEYDPDGDGPIGFQPLNDMPWVHVGWGSGCESSCGVYLDEEIPTRISAYTTHKCGYTVAYDCGIGSNSTVSSTSVISGQSYTLNSVNSCVPKTGYVLKPSGTNIIGGGWICSADNTSNSYLNATSGTWQWTDNYTCEAQWDCDDGFVWENGECVQSVSYTVTYYSGNCDPNNILNQTATTYSGTDTAVSSQSYSPLSPNNPSINIWDNINMAYDMNDYDACSSFQYWRTYDDVNYGLCNMSGMVSGSVAAYTCGNQITPFNSNVNLYAVCKWAEYDVFYHGCNDEISKVMGTATYGVPYTVLSSYIQDWTLSSGQNFIGWAAVENPTSADVISTYTQEECLNPKHKTIHLYAVCERNTIRLKWKLNGGTMSYTNPSSCSYGISDGNPGDISTVNEPNKAGYSFLGWLITGWNQCSLQDLGVSTSSDYYARSDSSYGMCSINGQNNTTNCSNSVLNDLQAYDWKIVYSHGTLYGTSMCSSTTGNSPNAVNEPTVGVPSSSSGGGCWCRATQYVPNNGAQQCNFNVYDEWVFYMSSNTGVCKQHCANNCANNVLNNQYFYPTFFATY